MKITCLLILLPLLTVQTCSDYYDNQFSCDSLANAGCNSNICCQNIFKGVYNKSQKWCYHIDEINLKTSFSSKNICNDLTNAGCQVTGLEYLCKYTAIPGCQEISCISLPQDACKGVSNTCKWTSSCLIEIAGSDSTCTTFTNRFTCLNSIQQPCFWQVETKTCLQLSNPPDYSCSTLAVNQKGCKSIAPCAYFSEGECVRCDTRTDGAYYWDTVLFSCELFTNQVGISCNNVLNEAACISLNEGGQFYCQWSGLNCEFQSCNSWLGFKSVCDVMPYCSYYNNYCDPKDCGYTSEEECIKTTDNQFCAWQNNTTCVMAGNLVFEQPFKIDKMSCFYLNSQGKSEPNKCQIFDPAQKSYPLGTECNYFTYDQCQQVIDSTNNLQCGANDLDSYGEYQCAYFSPTVDLANVIFKECSNRNKRACLIDNLSKKFKETTLDSCYWDGVTNTCLDFTGLAGSYTMTCENSSLTYCSTLVREDYFCYVNIAKKECQQMKFSFGICKSDDCVECDHQNITKQQCLEQKDECFYDSTCKSIRDEFDSIVTFTCAQSSQHYCETLKKENYFCYYDVGLDICKDMTIKQAPCNGDQSCVECDHQNLNSYQCLNEKKTCYFDYHKGECKQFDLNTLVITNFSSCIDYTREQCVKITGLQCIQNYVDNDFLCKPFYQGCVQDTDPNCYFDYTCQGLNKDACFSFNNDILICAWTDLGVCEEASLSNRSCHNLSEYGCKNLKQSNLFCQWQDVDCLQILLKQAECHNPNLSYDICKQAIDNNCYNSSVDQCAVFQYYQTSYTGVECKYFTAIQCTQIQDSTGYLRCAVSDTDPDSSLQCASFKQNCSGAEHCIIYPDCQNRNENACLIDKNSIDFEGIALFDCYFYSDQKLCLELDLNNANSADGLTCSGSTVNYCETLKKPQYFCYLDQTNGLCTYMYIGTSTCENIDNCVTCQHENHNSYSCLRQKDTCYYDHFNNKCDDFVSNVDLTDLECISFNYNQCLLVQGKPCVQTQYGYDFECQTFSESCGDQSNCFFQLSCSGLNKDSCLQEYTTVGFPQCSWTNDVCIDANQVQQVCGDLPPYICSSYQQSELFCQVESSQCINLDPQLIKCDHINHSLETCLLVEYESCVWYQTLEKCEKSSPLDIITSPQIECNVNYKLCLNVQNDYFCYLDNQSCVKFQGNTLISSLAITQLNKDLCGQAFQTYNDYAYLSTRLCYISYKAKWDQPLKQCIPLTEDHLKTSKCKDISGPNCKFIRTPGQKCKYKANINKCIDAFNEVYSQSALCDPEYNKNACLAVARQCVYIDDMVAFGPLQGSDITKNQSSPHGCMDFNSQENIWRCDQVSASFCQIIDTYNLKCLVKKNKCVEYDNESYSCNNLGINKLACLSISTNDKPCVFSFNGCTFVKDKHLKQMLPCSAFPIQICTQARPPYPLSQCYLDTLSSSCKVNPPSDTECIYLNYDACIHSVFNPTCKWISGACINSSQTPALGYDNCQSENILAVYVDTQDMLCKEIKEQNKAILNKLKCESLGVNQVTCLKIQTYGELCQWGFQGCKIYLAPPTSCSQASYNACPFVTGQGCYQNLVSGRCEVSDTNILTDSQTTCTTPIFNAKACIQISDCYWDGKKCLQFTESNDQSQFDVYCTDVHNDLCRKVQKDLQFCVTVADNCTFYFDEPLLDCYVRQNKAQCYKNNNCYWDFVNEECASRESIYPIESDVCNVLVDRSVCLSHHIPNVQCMWTGSQCLDLTLQSTFELKCQWFVSKIACVQGDQPSRCRWDRKYSECREWTSNDSQENIYCEDISISNCFLLDTKKCFKDFYHYVCASLPDDIYLPEGDHKYLSQKSCETFVEDQQHLITWDARSNQCLRGNVEYCPDIYLTCESLPYTEDMNQLQIINNLQSCFCTLAYGCINMQCVHKGANCNFTKVNGRSCITANDQCVPVECYTFTDQLLCDAQLTTLNCLWENNACINVTTCEQLKTELQCVENSIQGFIQRGQQMTCLWDLESCNTIHCTNLKKQECSLQSNDQCKWSPVKGLCMLPKPYCMEYLSELECSEAKVNGFQCFWETSRGICREDECSLREVALCEYDLNCKLYQTNLYRKECMPIPQNKCINIRQECDCWKQYGCQWTVTGSVCHQISCTDIEDESICNFYQEGLSCYWNPVNAVCFYKYNALVKDIETIIP